VPKHEFAARYTASRRRVQGSTRSWSMPSDEGVDPPLGEGTVADAVCVCWHPLNANIAERSWGAPTKGRSAEVVVETTDNIVANGDDEPAADGEPVPLAKRGVAEAAPDFGWNSCRFIATRFR
jgi:hypothetical protein